MSPNLTLGPGTPVAAWQERRDAGWVLRRCARKGHVLARLSAGDPLVNETGPLSGASDRAELLRCLRCGTWVTTDAVAVAAIVGTAENPATLGEVPLVARGPHGRRFGLLRLLAVERGLRGLLMIVAGVAAFHVADSRGSLLSYIERLAVAARPLGEQFGVHITESWAFREVEKYLGGTGDPVRMAGLGLVAYGVVQVVEGVGLWGGKRWAEYLAVVVTSAFVPFEVYELMHNPTPLKAAALVVNLFVVAYLLFKGRLFGLRGGHAAFLDEVRNSTLLADLLRAQGRAPAELTSETIV